MSTSKESGKAKKSTTTSKSSAKNTAPKARAPRAQAGTARSKSAKPPSSPITVTPEERWRMVAVAAYHKAEQRGFGSEGAMDDWLDAEKEVDELLGTQLS